MYFFKKPKYLHLTYFLKKISFGIFIGVVVDCEGRSGALALLWKHDVDFTIYQYSKYHIHGMLSLGSREESFWITSVYGHPKLSLGPDIWNLPRALKNNEGQLWLVFGDFNEVEKMGRGHTQGEGQMWAFCDCLTDYELNDLGFLGFPFTWCDNH